MSTRRHLSESSRRSDAARDLPWRANGLTKRGKHENSNETQSDDVEPDTRDKIDTVVVNWNMAGINENAYVLSFSK